MTSDAKARTNARSTSWDMSQERAFVETLLGQRFNYFLLFFSLIIAGSVAAKSTLHFKIVLTLGTLICWLLSATLYRAQVKLDLILEELSKDSNHPTTVIDRKTSKSFSMRRLIGYVIPSLCSLSLTVGTILAFFGVLTP